MKVRCALILLFFVLNATIVMGQRYAVASGNWNAAIWAATPDGVAGSAGTPTIADDVYTNGFVVTVNNTFSCRNLYLEYDVVNGLSFSSALTRLNIDGSLAVWDTEAGFFAEPAVDVIENEGKIRFTGGNADLNNADVILFWDHTVADFGFIEFDFGSGNIRTIFETINIGQHGTTPRDLRVLTGTLKTSPGAELHGISNSSVIVNPSAVLETDDAISGGTSGSKIGTVTINGTLTTSSYINSTNLSIGSSGTLNSFFNGPDQTEGWWYQSNRPTGGIISSTGTVSLKASAAQNFYARDYGNLILDGTGTKALVGASTLNINGNFTVNTSSVSPNTDAAPAINIGGNVTNNGAWAPLDLVTFNGAGAQAVGGGNPITFNGGLSVNKSAGTLTLNRGVTIVNDLTISAGTLDLGSQTVTLSSGNIDNGGTLTASSSTIVINGTSSVTGASVTSLFNLTVNAGGNFTAANNMAIAGTLTNNGIVSVSSGGNLNINGNFANAGTFNANNGTVTFSGSSTQTISGASALAFTNMVVNNNLNNNGIVNLSGTYSMNGTAVFDADGSGAGSFTLRSTGLTGGGRIGELTAPGNFSGNVTIERYLDGPADWRYLSMPLLTTTAGGTTNVGLWKANFPVTGEFSDPSPTGSNGVTCASPGTVGCASIFYFDPALGYVDVGSGGTVASTALDYRKGYSVYTYLPGSFTLSVSGSPVKGSVSIPLSTGWNLVPNPYPSAIDWDNMTRTGTTNTMYFTTAQGAYSTYLQGSPCTGCSFNTSWTGEVAIGQSFWIESTGATSLPLAEASKATNATFVRQKGHEDYFRVTLKSGAKEDDMIVRFATDATTDLEYTLDAKKRKNPYYINLSSYNADPAVEYAINTLPFISCNSSVKLNLTDVAAGAYSLKFTELETLTTGYELMLIDKFLSSETRISSNSEYSFDVTADAASYGADRFEINIVSPEVDVTRDLALSSTLECNNDLVRLNIDNAQPGIQYVFKAGDIALNTPVAGNGGNAVAWIEKSMLAFGLNKLNLVASSMDGCHAHIFDEAISVRFDAIEEITSVTPGQNCGAGAVSLSASGASADGYYRWYESENAIEPIEGATTASFTTPSIAATRLYYVSAVNANGCESALRVPVEARIVDAAKPEITVDGHDLTVNAKTGIQWYKDGTAIEGATSPSYSVKHTGEYSVSVAKDGCTAGSDVFQFIINGAESKHSVHGFSLSPNPTRDILYVNGPSFANATVVLYDSKGRRMNVEGTMVNESQMSFDLTGTRNGLYLVNIQSQQKLIQLKAIKK